MYQPLPEPNRPRRTRRSPLASRRAASSPKRGDRRRCRVGQRVQFESARFASDRRHPAPHASAHQRQRECLGAFSHERIPAGQGRGWRVAVQTLEALSRSMEETDPLQDGSRRWDPSTNVGAT
jgi:hypothetical protein